MERGEQPSQSTKQQSNQFTICLLVNWWSCLVGWNGINQSSFFDFFDLWVMGGRGRQCSAKRRKQSKKEVKIDEMKAKAKRAQWNEMEWKQAINKLFFNEEKWSWLSCAMEWNEQAVPQGVSRRGKPTSSLSLLLARRAPSKREKRAEWLTAFRNLNLWKLWVMGRRPLCREEIPFRSHSLPASFHSSCLLLVFD